MKLLHYFGKSNWAVDCFRAYLLIILLALLPISLSAQENIPRIRFSIYSGAEIPMGDFSSDGEPESGYANAGFGGMIEATKIFGGRIGQTTSLTLSVNELDESRMEDRYPGINPIAGDYFTTWALSGIRCEMVVSPIAKVYGLGQMGVLVSKLPDITMFGGSTSSITQTTKLAMAFAYGFGVGVILNKINLSIRYYHGKPEYEQAAGYPGLFYNKKIMISTQLLNILIGIEI